MKIIFVKTYLFLYILLKTFSVLLTNILSLILYSNVCINIMKFESSKYTHIFIFLKI